MQYTYNTGRIFISPIIGCEGGCKYCYLPSEIENFDKVRKNSYSISEIIRNVKKDKRFIKGRNGTIISIGAYCDIFPNKDNDSLSKESVDWIIECLKVGNPVQIISKNTLDEELVKKIAENIQYENQLLYSTTITTFDRWEKIEPFSAKPEERIATLTLFKKYNIPTNVMIKPFIPGVTEKEVDKFREILRLETIDYVVVGELYITDIKGEVEAVLENNYENKIDVNNRVLDCTEDKSFKTIGEEKMKEFIKLISNERKIFRKSSCVNANMLGDNNASRYYQGSYDGYCIGCGNCR